MPNYNNSVPFDSNLWSDSPNVEKAVEHLMLEIEGTGKITRWHQRYTYHLKLIVLNLYNNYVIDSEMYTAYSRNKNAYGNSKFYNVVELQYNSMVKIVDILWLNLGYIEGVKGYHFPGKDRTRNARMIATPKLLELLFCKYKVRPTEITRNPDERTIILKDDKKAEINYELTAD